MIELFHMMQEREDAFPEQLEQEVARLDGTRSIAHSDVSFYLEMSPE